MSRAVPVSPLNPSEPRPRYVRTGRLALPAGATLPPAAESGPRLSPLERRASRTKSDRPPASWLRVEEAAQILGVAVITFRRAIDRHARRDADGRIFSEFDGVRARKLGRQWRVLLDPCWSVDGSPA